VRHRVRPFDEKGIQHESADVSGGVARRLRGSACAHGSMADLNVYDRTEGKRPAVYWHEGRAYVVGKPATNTR
jgi:hypothetical protein